MNSERRVRYACNRFFICMMLVSVFFASVAVLLIREGDIGEGIGSAILALVILALVTLLMPWGYRFDQKGVTICYLLLPNQRFLWENIWSIEVHWGSREPASFLLEGRPEGKISFYMEGKIHKNRRTKRLLEAYWDCTVTGYFYEDLKKWLNKRRNKRQKKIRQHRTDEIVPMERAVREETRSALALFDAQAAQLGLELRLKFYYETNDMEEMNSRPNANYVYAVLIELCRPGERDDSKIITTGAELLHVRLGKTAYRGVKDDGALPDLREELTEVLEEVRKIGFDAYCAE